MTTEYPSIVNEMMSFIHWQGQDAFKGGQYTLTDPGVVAALETYRKVVGANAPLGSNQTMQHRTFLDGNAGFMLDSPWSYALLNTAPDAVRPSLKMMAVPFRPHMGGAANSLHPGGHLCRPQGAGVAVHQASAHAARMAAAPFVDLLHPVCQAR